MTWYESLIDRQIREAQERGEFDDLPGAGKPLPGYGEGYDEDWWLKKLVHREQIGSAVLPTSLALRKEAEDLMETVAKKTSEASVRAVVEDLNARIVRALRGPVDGPPLGLSTFDVDAVVRAWRERRRRS